MDCLNSTDNVCLNMSNNSYIDATGPYIAEWGFWIKFISTPIIVLIGIIGNTLSLFVMKAKTLRHKSYSQFLCALAVFDTLSLISRQIESVDEYYVSYLAKPGVFQNFNDFGCKTYNYISHVVTLMSSWLVVFMAIERLIAVCFPFKNAFFRSQSGAKIGIGLLFLVSLSQVFRIVMIKHLHYDTEYGIWDCLANDDYIELYTSLDVYFFQWALVFALPVLLIITCNCLVIYQIFKVRRALCKNATYMRYTEHGLTPAKVREFRRHKSVEKKHRSTCMLLTVTFTYILTLLPLFTLSLIVDLSIKLGDMDTARYIFLTLKPYIDICVSISLLNYAVNFFIYVLSGKRFRFELQRLFRKKGRIKRGFTARSTREEQMRM